MRRLWMQFLRRLMNQPTRDYVAGSSADLDEARKISESLHIRMDETLRVLDAEIELYRLSQKGHHVDHPRH